MRTGSLGCAGYFHFNRMMPMRNIDPFRISPINTSLFRTLLAPAVWGLAAFGGCLDSPAELRAADEKAPAIVIRPANFDPADELAYTRQRGELAPGAVANGKFWNTPVDVSRAAVSSEVPAPAEAAGQGPLVPAASGTLAPRMSYAEAYAMVPFSRAEYEANPGYRHDAAMELMFGTMRPTVTARMNLPYFSRYPDMFRYRFPVYPYLNSLGNGSSNTNMWWNTSLIAY
jgi:hypothetical protein